MKRQLKKLILASALMVMPFAAMAGNHFESASFNFTGEQLLQKVTLNNLPSSGLVLYCRADISTAGSAERVSCYSGGSESELVPATEEALQTLAFNVASIEGSAVPVRMSFRVAFSKVNDGTYAALIPNIGTMQAQYGRDYVAPQERLDVSDWYERYSDNSWAGGQEFLGRGDMSRVAATIRPDGKPAMIKTLETTRALARDTNVVKVSLKHSRFIPGTVNGKVVPMQYMVAVHYGDSDRAYADAK